MFLSDNDIKKAVLSEDITISDFTESRLQPASYDVLLGNKFVITDTHSSGYTDPYNKIYPRTREIVIKDHEPFILHPGISVLAYIHDYVGAKRDHLIHLSGKSSLARAGLIVHNTAGIINPGHYLNITLELSNTSNIPIILRPKMEIAQLLFSKMTSPSSHNWVQTSTYIDVDHYANTPVASDGNSGNGKFHKEEAKPLLQNSSVKNSVDRHPEYQYLDLLRETLNGEEQVDSGTGVKTYSVFGRQMRFDLSKGFPLLTTKKVYWKGVLHELYWFLSGQSNIKYLVDNGVHIWDDYPYKIYKEKAEQAGESPITKEEFIDKIANDKEFAMENGELPHIYGELWRRWQAKDGDTVDQLGWVIDELKKDPDAHNTLVSSWNPEYLYSMAKPGKAARFPICHNLYQVNIKNGKVCLQLYQRSADIFLGVPFNIASYALLTMVIAKILGREAGEFVHTFGDLHMYENHRDQVKEQLEREPKAFPTLKIDGIVNSLEDFKTEQVILENYEPHASIKAELTAAGGYNEKIHKKEDIISKDDAVKENLDNIIHNLHKQTTTDNT